MTKGQAISLYQNHVLKGFPKIRLSGSDSEKELVSLHVIRYIIGHILGWTPSDAFYHLTHDIVKATHMDIFIKHLQFPKGLVSDELQYLAHYVYPKEYAAKEEIREIYKKIRQGEMRRFPKYYFEGNLGQRNARTVLIEFVNQFLYVRDTEDLYAKFADNAYISRKMNEAKIFHLYSNHFFSPLQFLHESLTVSERDDFLYGYYEFTQAFNKAIAEESAKKN